MYAYFGRFQGHNMISKLSSNILYMYLKNVILQRNNSKSLDKKLYKNTGYYLIAVLENDIVRPKK